MLKDIFNNKNVENYLFEIIDRVHKKGPVLAEDFEVLAYIKLFYYEIFNVHEQKLLSTMGLFYKKDESKTVLEEVYSIYENIIEEKTGRKFTPVQAHAYINIQNKKYFSFSAPTSAGKSYLFRELIQDVDYDIVIVVPSRALITEYINTLYRLLEDDTSVLILPFIENINISKTARRIFVITPERGVDLFKQIDKFNIKLFLLDEAQISEDEIRGMKFDSFVRRIDKFLPDAKKVFAHPFISNPDAQLIKHNFNQNSSYKTYNQHSVGKIYLSINSSGNFQYFSPFLNSRDRVLRDTSNDIIKNILLNNGTLLIYTSKKKIYNNQYMLDFAEYIDLCEELTDELALRLIEKLRKFIGASEHSEEKHSWFIDMMKKGIAIHHGSMPLNARLIMEDFVRLGYAKICFSTATLLQGINMPFDVVWIDNFMDMTPLNLKNLIGRAGRTTSHKKEFEFGIVVINKKNISTFSERIKDNYEIKYTSMLDEDVSNLDDDLKDIAEAIKNNTFDDELKLTHSQVERLKSDDIMADILHILNNLLDSNNKPIIGQEYNSLSDHFKGKIKTAFKNIFIQHLRRSSLTKGESGVLGTAIIIMLWHIQGKSFSEIISLRHAYLTHKDERNEIMLKVSSGELSLIEAKEKIRAIFVSPTPIPESLPNSKLNHIARFPNTSVDKIDYDLLVYDTYDYLDKVISLSLSDPICGALQLYYDKTGDNRALIMKNYIRYGTNNQKEIWLLRYGFSFEDIEWLEEYVQDINENAINFISSISELDEDKQKLIERYL